MENDMNKQEPQEAQVVEQPQAQTPKVATGSFFKEKRKQYNEVKTMEMPSGIFLEVRRPDVAKLVRQGHIPADVAVDISNMIDRAQQSHKNGAEFKLSDDEYKKYMNTVDDIAIASIVSPKVKKGEVTEQEYDDNIISVDDLEQIDKEFLFTYANSGVNDLKPFRQKE